MTNAAGFQQRPGGGSSPLRRIEPHQVHVYCAYTQDIASEAGLLTEYETLLSAEERSRMERFLVERVRVEFLITRALVRTTLARYVGSAPRELEFVANPHGKPRLVGTSDISFNLSNTHDLVVCAVVRGHAIGVDVESTTRHSATVEIADRFFSEAEVLALRKTPEEAQRDMFFRFWTLKEAYIKAKGKGLAIPLGDFAFQFDEETINISFAPSLLDEPGLWHFFMQRPSPTHQLAVGFACGVNSPHPIHIYRTIPLREQGEQLTSVQMTRRRSEAPRPSTTSAAARENR